MLNEIKRETDRSHEAKSYYDGIYKNYSEQYSNIQLHIDSNKDAKNYNDSLLGGDKTERCAGLGQHNKHQSQKKKLVQNSSKKDYICYPLGINRGKIAAPLNIY